MRKAYGFALLITAALALHGCSKNETSDEAAAPVAKAAPPGANPADFQLAAAQRAVIRNGEITVRVDSVEKAERSVVKSVNAWQGFVSESKSTDLAGDHPDGICVDADGAVWYADVGNKHCVRVSEDVSCCKRSSSTAAASPACSAAKTEERCSWSRRSGVAPRTCKAGNVPARC